jgi:hypothetical protein
LWEGRSASAAHRRPARRRAVAAFSPALPARESPRRAAPSPSVRRVGPALLPRVVFALGPPDVRDGRSAQERARVDPASMGPWSRRELSMALVFATRLVLGSDEGRAAPARHDRGRMGPRRLPAVDRDADTGARHRRRGPRGTRSRGSAGS